MPAFRMGIFGAINFIEARVTQTGGLDFEANFEFVFMCMLKDVMEHRI